jgi:hypothetical protein
VAGIERDPALKPTESRAQIIDVIRKHYTAPAWSLSALHQRGSQGLAQGFLPFGA